MSTPDREVQILLRKPKEHKAEAWCTWPFSTTSFGVFLLINLFPRAEWFAAQYLNAGFTMMHPDTTPQSVQQPKKEHCRSPENSPGTREPSLSSEPFQSIGSHQRRTNGLQSHCCGQKHNSWTPQMLPHSCAVGRARNMCGKAARLKRILHLSAGKGPWISVCMLRPSGSFEW